MRLIPSNKDWLTWSTNSRSNSSDEQASRSKERETFGHFQQIDSRYNKRRNTGMWILLGAQRSGGRGSKDPRIRSTESKVLLGCSLVGIVDSQLSYTIVAATCPVARRIHHKLIWLAGPCQDVYSQLPCGGLFVIKGGFPYLSVYARRLGFFHIKGTHENPGVWAAGTETKRFGLNNCIIT